MGYKANFHHPLLTKEIPCPCAKNANSQGQQPGHTQEKAEAVCGMHVIERRRKAVLITVPVEVCRTDV